MVSAPQREGKFVMNQRVKGALLTLLGGSCWGISGCTGQYLFTREGMDTSWLVPIRLLLAGVLMCGYYFIKDRKLLVAPWKHRRSAIDLLIYGLAGVSGCQFLYFLTIQLSNAGVATILQDLSPVGILLVTCVTGRCWPRRREVASIALALIGVFLLTTHGSLTDLAVSPQALLVGTLSAVCVVIYSMWPRKLQRTYPTALLQGWAFFLGGVMFHLVFRPWEMGYVPSVRGVLGIAIVVLVGNVVAFTCYMQGVKLIGPQKASLYSFAEPLVAALIGATLLGSPFTGWDALGFACVFAMLVLLSRPEGEST
jgi:drug/metabolite transporter (DMT)-like permease